MKGFYQKAGRGNKEQRSRTLTEHFFVFVFVSIRFVFKLHEFHRIRIANHFSFLTSE